MGNGFPFLDVFILQWGGCLPDYKESVVLNPFPSNPLPLQETQSRTLCSVQPPDCYPSWMEPNKPIVVQLSGLSAKLDSMGINCVFNLVFGKSSCVWGLCTTTFQVLFKKTLCGMPSTLLSHCLVLYTYSSPKSKMSFMITAGCSLRMPLTDPDAAT